MNDHDSAPVSDERWLLLINTVPASPSRTRATVWRELKKLGAVYLRDGVAVLPNSDMTATAFGSLCDRITRFSGQGTVVANVSLDPRAVSTVMQTARIEREAEYAALEREATRLAEHIKRERALRDFTFPEIHALTTDLRKLREWTGQLQSRDYFVASG